MPKRLKKLEELNEEEIIKYLKVSASQQKVDILMMYMGLENNIIPPTKLIAKKYNKTARQIIDIIKYQHQRMTVLSNYSLDEVRNRINEIRKHNNQETIVTYKTSELIKTIHKLHRTPTPKHNNQKAEAKFRDNTDQGNYYCRVRRNYEKIALHLSSARLTEPDKQVMTDYDAIKKALYMYSRKKQYIDSIHELHRRPKYTNHGTPEKTFEDGYDQSLYYNHLRYLVSKIYDKQNTNKPLNLREKEVLEDYNDIKETYDLYSKKTQLIKTIHELHRIPKAKTINNVEPERRFEDGSDQGMYYINLRHSMSVVYKKTLQGKKLSLNDLEIIDEYQKIQDVLNLYSKKTQLIKSINQLHRPPKSKNQNHGIPEKLFEDGTDQGQYLINLIKRVQSIKNGTPTSLIESELLQEYKDIENVIENNKVTTTKKKDEKRSKSKTSAANITHQDIQGNSQADCYFYIKSLSSDKNASSIKSKKTNGDKILKAIKHRDIKGQVIACIHKYHKIPQQITTYSSAYSNTKKVATSREYTYYLELRQNVKIIREKIHNGKTLTEEEKTILNDYKEIRETLDLYSKKTQLIKTIHELHRVPSLKQNSDNDAERVFEDGTEQAAYYRNINTQAKKIFKKIIHNEFLSLKEEELLKDYLEIQEVLDIYSNRNKLIKSIHENHQAPQTKPNDDTQVEYNQLFYFYHNLLNYGRKKQYKLDNGDEKISNHEIDRIIDYRKVINTLSFYPERSEENIELIKDLCHIHHIDLEKNKSILGRPFHEVYAKMAFLKDQCIPISDFDGIIHEIFFMSDGQIQYTYNISLDEMINKYITGTVNSKGENYVYTKLYK